MKQFYAYALIFLCSIFTTKTTAQFRIVGYLNTWDNFPDNAANLDYTKITHLNIAFANPDANGHLTEFDSLSTVVKNAHAANVKVLMSMGGADLNGTKKNWKNLTQPANVQAFCDTLLAYVQAHHLDGLDVDLEGNIVGKNYGSFIQTLSSVLKPKHKLVTAAVATWFADQIPSSCFPYFDFANIMSYDSTGPWDPNHPGPHSTYTMAVSDLNFWAAKGLPINKTGLGVPFYGWGFYNKFSQDEYAYGDLVNQYPGAQNEDQVADTIYYNGIPTIKKKTNLALKKASGIMIWQLTEDAQGKYSLLNTIYKTVHKTSVTNDDTNVSAIVPYSK
ncbi:MAG TPA: glycosyl hydrolase family 18 protein [Parafilimonas sp.]